MPAAHAACGAPINEIEAENCKPGTPENVWQVPGAGDGNIKGFATDISVAQGDTVAFKIKTDATDYRVEIYRLGWYQGNGARLVDTVQPSVTLPQGQPNCGGDASTGLTDCGNWGASAAWVAPADATSGLYLAVPIREDGTQGASHIPFVVRDDDGASDLLFQTSDTTWQAYNDYGGKSLYKPSLDDRAYKVSYNRPFDTRQESDEDWLFNSEYPMIRWLERNGYDVSYFTGVDSDRFGAEMREHKAFLSVGHDEYWSADQRGNVEAARDAGVNLAFFSGNEVFWKTRWENGHRTLVCYKETGAGAKIDLTGPWTGTWRDTRSFNPEGPRPENALTGQLFTVNAGTTAIEVPAADGKLRFWRGTDVAALAPGTTATLAEDTLGYEWDEDVDNGARPAGLMRLSSTTVEDVDKLQDNGWEYGPGTATHHLTLYRDTNGTAPDALVFGAGTVQWPWGLDSTHERGGAPVSRAMQQATTNLLADMGVQPVSLQSELLAASPSTDVTGPSAFVAGQASIAVVAGTPASVIGTASDVDGQVAAVEVSVDGGSSWHPANGREQWSYTWTPSASGQVAPLARAADDTGNLTGASPPPGGGGSTPPGPSGSGGGSKIGSGANPGASGDVPKGATVGVGPRRVRMSRDGTVRLRLSCPHGEHDCHVKLRLRLNGRSIGGKTLLVAAGDARSAELKLKRAVRRKLIRKRSLRIKVIATSDGTKTRTAIRLRAPRRLP